MLVNYNDEHLETNKIKLQQKALTLYRQLKTLKKSELTLEEELLIENFDTALRLWHSPPLSGCRYL